jgi:acetate kinase
MPDAILSLNAGSSSLKFALFDADGLDRLVSGAIETDGATARFRARDGAGNILADEEQSASPQDAVAGLLDWIERHLGANALVAAGHRVVHGGPHHYAPEIVTPELIAALEQLAPLAPLHQMHDLAPVRAIAAARPRLPQIVCFDTAFHKDIKPVAARFGLPRAYEADGFRRFGFHGLSYEYIAGKLTAVAPHVAHKKVIVAHLGNGASLCAMENGRSIDTSMGMTPLDGLVMGTRCGAIDPGVVLFLLRERNMTADAVEDLLYRHSGLLGVSGISSDMRTLQQSPDIRAAEAIDLFVFRAAREIAALAASLQGLDALVFTAGIGEHAPDIRRRICERMAWLGLELDGDANAAGKLNISTPGSRIAAFVIPTDEEWMIARHTRQALQRDVAGARS